MGLSALEFTEWVDVEEKNREEACTCTIRSKALYDFASITGAATPAVPGTDAVETLLTDRFSLHR